MKQQFYKLVRDKLPQILMQDKTVHNYKVEIETDPEQISILVRNKLREELDEVLAAKDKKNLTEELADLLEIMRKYAEINNISFDEVQAEAIGKMLKYGQFDNNVVLKMIEYK